MNSCLRPGTLAILAPFAVLGACMLTGAAGAFAPRESTESSGSPAQSLPVNDNVGQGAWSPDGRTVTFARILKQRTLLMVVDVASGRTRTLAKLPRDPAQFPTAASSFSSDGRLIGVVVTFRLHIVDTRGRVVLDSLADVNSFTFSPNGRHVAITTPTDPPRVLIVDLRSRRSRQLAKNAVSPRWSPRGDWIAFIRRRPDLCDLHLIRPNGTGNHRLIPWICTFYGWSPDGTRFALNDGGSINIY